MKKILLAIAFMSLFMISNSVQAWTNEGNMFGISTEHPPYTPVLNPFCQSGWCDQCTAFAWGRALDRLGISISARGHACEWWNTSDAKYSQQTTDTPRANSFAIWMNPAETCNDDYVGHVAYVEKVDGDFVYINEANWGGPYYSGFTKRFTTEEILNRNGYILKGYLHLNSPFSDYNYWDFDTQGTEDWNARESLNQGLVFGRFWQIGSSFGDNSNKRGVVSPVLNQVHTDNYGALQIEFGINNRFLDHVDAYFMINNTWVGPEVINWFSGSEGVLNGQNVYRGMINGNGQIQQIRIDFDKGSESEDCRIFINNISFIDSESNSFTPWPDTGQTNSYTNTFGEDSDYRINPQSYTKLGYNGIELSDGVTPANGWIMTKDNVTGLIWEVKTNDSSIHDRGNAYTWCDPNPETNEGAAGTCGTGNDTSDFITELNNENFGGFSDWRMPTIREITTLVNSGSYNPNINTVFFPNTANSYSWSSTTYADNNLVAWGVAFFAGSIEASYKLADYYVRAVRGPKITSPSLIDNVNGTVTDTATGLMWQKTTLGPMDWESAITYCESLSFSDHDDWRLPNRNELHSLVDYSRHTPAIDTSFFTGTVSSNYWSSTTKFNYSDRAWTLDFIDGAVYSKNKLDNYYVRAVRGGRSASMQPAVPLSMPWIPLLLLE